MGNLDNSTVNVYVDAVLTDLGRKYLARNDGSFEITKFALGDDEVDYTLIKKHGLIAGKAKIENNTSVFEALTNETIGQKYKLVSMTNPELKKIPTLGLDVTTAGAGSHTTSLVNLSLGTAGQQSATLTFKQTLLNMAFDAEQIDYTFEFELDNRFLQITNDTPVTINPTTNKAKYFIPATSTDVNNGASISVTVKSKTLSNADFQTYGKTQNKNIIITYLKIKGVNTGVERNIQINISKV